MIARKVARSTLRPKKSAAVLRRERAHAYAARLVGRVYDQVEQARADLRKLAQDARDSCDLATAQAKEADRLDEQSTAAAKRGAAAFHDGRSVGLESCASVLQALLARRVA